MSLMGDGLKRLSGHKLEPILYKLSSSPIKGMALGSGVTAVIQSSSATSVIVVGFVNSGMMKLKQAIPIILGAIFGTSITGWIVSLSYIEGGGSLSSILSTATLTGAVAIVGIGFRMFSKKKNLHNVGDIMMGFAILMVGMSTMSSAVVGLKNEAWFNDLLTTMRNPVLGIITGILISALLQSASAAVGILQALSVTGQVSFANGLPILMGISIGAALPVMLAALGTNTNGKRAALSYLVSSFMGVMTLASIFFLIDAMVHLPFSDAVMTPFTLAGVNTVFRFCLVLILLPFTDILETLVTLMVHESAEQGSKVVHLDERFTRYPTLAFEKSRETINEMAKSARQAVLEANALVGRFTDAGFEKVESLEDEGDQYEDALGSFLMKLVGQDLSEKQSRESSIFLHTLSDLERISDHALNIGMSAKELNEKGISFSDDAKHELSVVMAAVREILHITMDAFAEDNVALADRVEPLEEVIDDICDDMKSRHVERLQSGKCSVAQGFVFNDLITAYERISDHCSNIAVAIMEIYTGPFATHEYLGTIKAKRTDSFEEYYKEYRARFIIEEKHD
ncbi:MAG: Na/Pi cotransporter family protein [Lachnospiraceae bacterium]|nr:Na/Pi cotransporter family protein [Lachnospiraceae bacterium]